jgi:tripartite-type tricarboxylate transporter receptor subunit TctC
MLRIITLAACVAASLFASQAKAAWPERPVTLLVPFAAGGLTDLLARVTAERLEATFKQPFIVQNAPGAAGTIATQRAARAEPDGYTLFFATISQITIAPFTHKLDFDPMKAFAPISMIFTAPFIVTVRDSFPANDVREFVAHVKANPGKIPYSSAGPGSLSHLSAAVFLKSAGLDMIHVPYKGIAPAFAALLGGQVEMLAASPVELRPHMDTKKLKLLAATSAERIKTLPDVPTIAEVFPGAPAVVTWNGVLAPTGTPQDVIAALSRAIMEAEKSPDFRERLTQLGVDPVVGAPADFAKIIAEDTARWRELIPELGLQAK